MQRALAFIVLTGTACAATSCGHSSNAVSGQQVGLPASAAPVAQERTADGRVAERSDINGDGRVDVFLLADEVMGPDNKLRKVPVRKEVDLNADGKVDLTQYFDEGVVAREELDLDFDGRVDKVARYKDERVESEELSSLFDGRFDVRRYYENGVLVLKQVDTRRNGLFDEFQYFVGNKLARIGWDRDGDGKPELFEENPGVE